MRKWNFKEKAKLRFNFAEDPKRIWNKISLGKSLAPKLRPQDFVDHYAKNLDNSSNSLDLEE
jgi:hypothetical protein